MIIRNDDVGCDTNLAHLKQFCRICDEHGIRILQAITVSGVCVEINRAMTNEEILKRGVGKSFGQRRDLQMFLANRDDLIAVHGLFHTHEPTPAEINVASLYLQQLGLKPTYFVPPFNEGAYGRSVCGLKVSGRDAGKLENCIAYQSTPGDTEIYYLHSWRFDHACPRIYKQPILKRQLTLEDLDHWLQQHRQALAATGR
jgi:hypothetical protein